MKHVVTRDVIGVRKGTTQLLEHHEPHACACEGQMRSDVRDTTRLRKMCVRQGGSDYTSRRLQGIHYFLQTKLLGKICEFTIYGLSIGCLAICDLAIRCLGVLVIDSLDVRVAINYVKMMMRKKLR